jgi:hypothetical protein
MRFIFAAVFIALVIGIFPSSAYAQMMNGYIVEDDGDTEREEAEGRLIVESLANGSATCAMLSANDFERVGEYYMGLMVGDVHVTMNAMMASQLGEGGEEHMHILMGQRLSECDPTAGDNGAILGAAWFPMMSMMNGISGSSWGTGVMYRHDASLWGIVCLSTMILFWIVGFLMLIALVRFLLGSRKVKK